MKLPPSTVCSFEEDHTTVYVPRGFRKQLIESAAKYGQSIKFFDETISFPMDPDIQMTGVTFKDYQKKGLGKLVIAREGVLVAPCGGGKTVTGIGVLTTLKQPTLVLVHTTDLMSQWQRELADKALIPGGVGQWGAGKRQRSQVTIATIQTLIKMPPPELRDLFAHFGCVILDEAHHCPADTFLAIVNLCPAKYRFGLTATPKRKDGLEFLMTDTIGPLLAEVTDADLKSEGRSQNCTVRFIPTMFYTHHTADEWTSLLKELTTDTDRNNLIIRNIQKTFEEGHFPLVLSDRVEHCHWICQQLMKLGMNAQVLIGSVSKAIRERIIVDARNNLVDVLIATSVADEGLDIPNLSCIHLTCPTANDSKTQQRIGRIRRPKEGKVSLVCDYHDLRVASCLRMAKARKSMYRRWGFIGENGRDL